MEFAYFFNSTPASYYEDSGSSSSKSKRAGLVL